MHRYITLVNWTDQGVRDFKATTSRADAASNVAEKCGGRIVDIRWTLGQYDLVVAIDAPDDQTAAAIGLSIASGGNVRLTTMRAFDRTEVTQILDKAL